MAKESKVTLNPEVLLGDCTPAGMGLLVNPGEVEVAGGWLVQSKEPVAPDPLCSEWPLAIHPSQWEVCMTGL